MKATLLISLLLLSAVNAFAQKINGISIDSPNEKVILYLNHQKISLATNSCFISNLNDGVYLIEAYSGNNRNKPIYKEKVTFNGNIMQIKINNNSHDCSNYKYHEMSTSDFNTFMNQYKALPFDSDKEKLLDVVLLSSGFNTDQMITLLKTETFDNDKKKLFKKIYPNLINKSAVFKILDIFTFNSDKKEITDYISSLNK